MKKLFNISLVILLFLSGAYVSNGQTEWNQFRGPARSGIVDDSFYNDNWNGKNLEQVWKKEIGSAFSELIFDNGTIYTMISETIDSTEGSEFLAAFEEASGKLLWKSRIDSIYFDEDGWGDGTRSTPAYDDNAIYSFSGHGKLTSSTKKNGEIIWQVDFVKEFGSTTPRWGFASSPLLTENMVIMEVGGTDEKAFAGFDKKTGKVLWTSGKGMASHDSPLLANINGEEQIIFANGNTLYSYNNNGDTLWTFTMPMSHLTAMPVLIDDNKLFLSGVRNPAFVIVEIVDNVPFEKLTGNTMKNDFSSSIYYNGYIYGFNVAAVRCISAESGETKWTKRGYGKGALSMAGNKLVIISDKGRLIIAQATPDEYKELASVQAIEGKSWTAPSINNGKIYVRNLTEMACYKVN